MSRNRRPHRRPRRRFNLRLRDFVAFGLGVVAGAGLIILLPGLRDSVDGIEVSLGGAPDEVVITTAGEMVSMYNDNVFAADARYLDKKIHITGKVLGIGRNESDGTNIVSLIGTEPFSLGWVNCLFDDRDRDEFSSLRQNLVVTVLGVGGGDEARAGLTIRDCKLVKIHP